MCLGVCAPECLDENGPVSESVCPRGPLHVTLCTLERQSACWPRSGLGVCVSVGPSQCVSVSACVQRSGCLGVPKAPSSPRARPCPAPGCRETPARGARGRGARLQAPTCPRRAGGAAASRGGGAWDPPGEGGAGRGGAAAERAREPPGGQRRCASHMPAGAWRRH